MSAETSQFRNKMGHPSFPYFVQDHDHDMRQEPNRLPGDKENTEPEAIQEAVQDGLVLRSHYLAYFLKWH